MNCITAGNVMVQLFLQTQPKYLLNNKKLQYLLCVAQMASLYGGEPLFDDDIRNLKNGFSLEQIADKFIYNRAIQEGKVADKSLSLSSDSFVLPYSSKALYELKEKISEEDKNLLIEVFVRFGSYKEETLCNLLNEFQPLRELPLWDFISKDSIIAFLKSAVNSDDFKDNGVLSFCVDSVVSCENDISKPQEPVVEEIQEVVENTQESVEVEQVAVSVPGPAPVMRDVLKERLSQGLTSFVTGKTYSVYIETVKEKPVKDVMILALKNNVRVAGVLNKVSDTLYCYTFVGVPSNIKITVDF